MTSDWQVRPVRVWAKGKAARRAGRGACAVLAGVLALSGCVTVNQDAPMPQEIGAQGIVIEHGLPKSLPEDSKGIPGSQLVLVPTESAAGLFVPLPFVSEVVTDAYHRYEASTLATHYAAIDLYGAVRGALEGSALLKGGEREPTRFIRSAMSSHAPTGATAWPWPGASKRANGPGAMSSTCRPPTAKTRWRKRCRQRCRPCAVSLATLRWSCASCSNATPRAHCRRAALVPTSAACIWLVRRRQACWRPSWCWRAAPKCWKTAPIM